MQLTLDQNLSKLIALPGFDQLVTSLRHSYGEGSRIEINCVRDGFTVTPLGSEEFAWVVKAPGKYAADAPILAGCETFVWDSTISRWVGEVNYNVEALTAQLFVGTTDTDEAKYLELAAQLIWRPSPAAGQQRSQVIESFFLDNTIWKGTELFPSTGTAIEATSNPLFTPVAILLAADVVNDNATLNTLEDIDGLTAPLEAGSWYHFRAVIRFTSAITTTGCRFTVDGPAFVAGDLNYRSTYPLTSSTQTVNEGLTAYDLPSASNANTITSGGIAVIEGHVKPTANGDLQLRFASEIANSAVTAKAGSCLFITRLNWP